MPEEDVSYRDASELAGGSALRNLVSKKGKRMARLLKANEEFRATPTALRRMIIRAALTETGALRQPLSEQISLMREILAEPEVGFEMNLSASVDTIKRDIQRVCAELGFANDSEERTTRPPATRARKVKPANLQPQATAPNFDDAVSPAAATGAEALIADQDDMFGGSQ